jgi:pyridoxine 4-dehydrogenase
LNEVKALAARKRVAPAQIALGWILTLSGRPGMPTIYSHSWWIDQQQGCAGFSGVSRLSDEEMAETDEIIQRNKLVGLVVEFG